MIASVADLAGSIEALVAEQAFAGVVRVDVGGATELRRAFGLADRARALPMTVDTRLGMASGSKTLTALAVLSLVEEGVLTLATRARPLLGHDLPLVGDDVTVEHLLSHRSGIGDYLDEGAGFDVAAYAMPVSVHLLATTEAFVPVLDGHRHKFAAGERFAYCNSGYVLLALLAERASGEPYHHLVAERVCRPAGMSATAFLRSDALPGDAALGYVLVDGQWRSNVFHLPVVGSGDGGAFTTVDDVHRLWAALLAGRVVSRAAVADMLRGRSEPDEAGSSYGLGIWLDAGGEVLRLTGGDAGVSFVSTHQPGAGVTATVIANTVEGAAPVTELVHDYQRARTGAVP